MDGPRIASDPPPHVGGYSLSVASQSKLGSELARGKDFDETTGDIIDAVASLTESEPGVWVETNP